MAKKKNPGTQLGPWAPGISKIIISGFKSIAEETSVEIRPLTVLAGPNSSGKSSLMQPLLLLKQTLEAQYDPGALLIDGAHVKFTLANQFLSRESNGEIPAKTMTVEVEVGDESTKLTFCKTGKAPIEVVKTSHRNTRVFGPNPSQRTTWEVGVNDSEKKLEETFEAVQGGGRHYFPQAERMEFSVQRDRCFLNIEASFYLHKNGTGPAFKMPIPYSGNIGAKITHIIHLPGLRGNPERTYPLVPAGTVFPGLFQQYAASVIHAWLKNSESAKLKALNEALDLLELQANILTEEIEETQVGVSVSRTRGGTKTDRVNIADVGLAVSQVLPVLAALIVAEPGQLVYIEQPEIHLHPRAQWKLAQLLANAANRGVRLVIETHSSLLLHGVLTCVAKGEISPNNVALHWFTRNSDGVTKVTTADIDAQGRYGNWPADFDDVEMTASNAYLDAVETKLMASQA